jgi:hypothetical protein
MRLPVWDSRGCLWGRCEFCVNNFRKGRKAFGERSRSSVCGEIRQHFASHPALRQGPVLIELLSDYPRGRSQEGYLDLLDGLVQLKEEFPVMARLNRLHGEIQWGFEQWSRMTHALGKSHQVEQAIYSLKLVDRFPNIKVIGFNLIVGFPGETVNEVLETQTTLHAMRFLLASLRRRDPAFQIQPRITIVSTLSPFGGGFDFGDPMVIRTLKTSPEWEALSRMSADQDSVLEITKSLPCFSLFDTTNTGELGSELAREFWETLPDTNMRAYADEVDGSFVILTEDGEVHGSLRLPDAYYLLALRLTEECTPVALLREKLASAFGDADWPEVVAELERAELLYVNARTGHCINTLPYTVQQQVDARWEAGKRMAESLAGTTAGD